MAGEALRLGPWRGARSVPVTARLLAAAAGASLRIGAALAQPVAPSHAHDGESEPREPATGGGYRRAAQHAEVAARLVRGSKPRTSSQPSELWRKL
jgi:hypothetical protein